MSVGSGTTQNVHDFGINGSSEDSDRLKRIQSLEPEQFEKLFLAPQNRVAGQLRKTFGNPTPVALAGFLLCDSTAAIDLLGWGGAGGNGRGTNASNGIFLYLGLLLLVAGGIGEFILGNSFPCVVFFTFGGYWGVLGATNMPFYNAQAGYGSDAAGVAAFDKSFMYFMFWFGFLCMVYTVAALRTNVCLVLILFVFDIAFPLLTASYWYAAEGMTVKAANCQKAGGALAFVGGIVGWYLFISLVLEGVDFPFSLPVGDLSQVIKGKTDRRKRAGAV